MVGRAGASALVLQVLVRLQKGWNGWLHRMARGRGCQKRTVGAGTWILCGLMEGDGNKLRSAGGKRLDSIGLRGMKAQAQVQVQVKGVN